MRQKSVMGAGHTFAAVPTIKSPRSVFNRSSGYKSTIDTDFLYPFYLDEALPGDTKSVKASIFLRMQSPTFKPLMDNMYVDTFFFFVPHRLVWSNFKKFMGEQANPADSISFTVPQITSPNVAAGGIPVGHLFDYFGLPTGPLNGGGATTGLTVNNLFGRSYNQIWNEWFRSEVLQNSVTVDLGDGPDTWANYNLLKRGKRFDYFTSALPFVQKGTAVPLPLGSSATVKTSSNNALFTGAQPEMTLRNTAGNLPGAAGLLYTQITTGGLRANTSGVGVDAAGMYPSNLYADLSAATASTVNDLRQSIALQQFMEQDARGGTRYIELVKSHFGVTSPDARLQRPELLSTFSTPLKIHPVAATATGDASQSIDNAIVGMVGGTGTGVSVGQGFNKSFTEHGCIIGLISVRADLTYQLGADRMWNRRTRYDFAWPILSRLGEQSILNREIYANLADGTGAAQKDGVFGYIPRYDEYRYKTSKITGALRSTYATTLDIWHLSEEFSTQPTLSSTFIQSAVPLDRCIPYPDEAHFILDTFFEQRDARALPIYSVPGLSKL